MNESMNFPGWGIAVGAVIAFAFSTGSACAAGPSNHPTGSDGARQHAVRYADLDLSTKSGAAALYVRLRNAARFVCEPLESRDLTFATRYRACVDRALTDAVAKVDSPMLSEYHKFRSTADKICPVRLAKGM